MIAKKVLSAIGAHLSEHRATTFLHRKETAMSDKTFDLTVEVPTDELLMRAALRRSVRLLCESCGKFTRDPPSHFCPGCEAYQEHQR